MSEQQKDSEVAGGVSTSAAPMDASLDASSTSSGSAVEAAKPSRRRATRAKAAPEKGDETPKPKKARSSSRGSKGKNVLLDVPADGDTLPESGQFQSDPVRRANGSLPPLPPAPVPTPEGIAFMQQHVAYQNALDQRAEAQRVMLARSTPASDRDPPPAGAKPEARGAGATSGKALRENSIEPGPAVRREHVSEADLQALDDTEDAKLLWLMLERSRSLRMLDSTAAAGERVAAAAQSDIGALRSIRDAVVRRLGLAIVEQNRQAEAGYKTEFDKLAPDLKPEAEASGTRKAPASRQSGASADRAEDKDAAALSTAVPDSVRKRFLQVDSDYYFPDRSPAFTDRGAKLATRGDHPEVVRALVEIARERGWDSVTVKGSETFRRAAWMEAARSGLQVTGYKPTDLDLAELKQREPRNSIEPGAVREQVSSHAASLAKPALQEKERALEEKLSAFDSGRPTLVVKQYPELVQAYALLNAARKFAEAHLPGHEARFVEIGKELITRQLRDGKDVIGPQVHPDRMSQPQRGREALDSSAVKADRSEVQVRER